MSSSRNFTAIIWQLIALVISASGTAIAQPEAPDVLFVVDRAGIGAQEPATGWGDSSNGSTGFGGTWQNSHAGSATNNSLNATSTAKVTGPAKLLTISASHNIAVYVRGTPTVTVTTSGTAQATATSDGIPRAGAGTTPVPFASGKSHAEAEKPFGPPGTDSDSGSGGGTFFQNIGCGGAGSSGARSFPQYPGVTYHSPANSNNFGSGATVRNDGPSISDVNIEASATLNISVVLGDDPPTGQIDGPYVGGQLGAKAHLGDTITFYNQSYDPDNQSGNAPLDGICQSLWEITDPRGIKTVPLTEIFAQFRAESSRGMTSLN